MKRLSLIILSFWMMSSIHLGISQDRPNIVWLVSEDNAAEYLRLYQADGVEMPNLERLASRGITFRNCHSQGAVCSVARSTLITGCHAPRIGAQFHRASERVNLPEGWKPFPAYLRESGYWTANNAKEDYNVIEGAEGWNESSRKASWRNREAGQPFFYVHNFHITHEGQLHKKWSEEDSLAGLDMTPQPYFPQDNRFRASVAQYHGQHRKLDEQMGAVLKELEQDGLMDETIIFYYGDHGGILPRSKGYLYESGLHVPLVVYVPEKWQKLFPKAPGSWQEGFVQFSDFGPTVLSLAGVPVPDHMDGRPFMGMGIEPSEVATWNTTFGYADRFDEKYEMVRSIRVGNYKYVRNFQPHHADGLYNQYRYRMPAYQAWLASYRSDTLADIQAAFFQTKAPEMLFDLSVDPNEVHNLAQDPAFADTLLSLRNVLRKQLLEMPDVGFFPEYYFLENGKETPLAFGEQHRVHIQRMTEIADLEILPWNQAKGSLKKSIHSPNPFERWWAWTSLCAFEGDSRKFKKQAKLAMENDPELMVRMRAGEWLVLHGEQLAWETLLTLPGKATRETEALQLLNSLANLRGLFPELPGSPERADFDPTWIDSPKSTVLLRIEYLEQTDGAGDLPNG
ncbi:sulfatase [Pontibacter sp. G13]|uniref:sulfatase family protein n=1 Tax=Pontibacter sp. G13 TaxID=3074898 RepID=UPI0028899A62|nr:sulfatase [Pontibacter sp. G13]WNJ17914.1 sulfatase [Pontibacter sp. G13]